MVVIGEERVGGEESGASRAGVRARAIDPVRALMIGLLAASFVSLALAALHRALNGDEYIFLSQIYRAYNHWPIDSSQTAYVHLFTWWLPHLGSNEAEQIIIGRLLFLPLWAGSLWLTYRLAMRLVEPTAALAGVTLYALFSYSLMSADSFRVDGLLLPTLLGAAWFLLDPSPRRVALAGFLSAVALALSLKAALWAPALAGILAVGLVDARRRILSVAAGTVTFLAGYGLILAVHSRLIARPDAVAPVFSAKQLSHVGQYMLFGQGLLPMPDAFRNAVVGNLPTVLLFAIGLVLLAAELKASPRRRRALLLLFLTLPILSVLFYANAFPYAYVYLLPGVCLVAGKGLARYADGATGWRRAIPVVLLVFAAMPLFFLTRPLGEDATVGDRQLLAEVHRLFPEPVPYIDVSGLVASFPREGTVITKLGLASPKSRGQPVFANYIRRDRPPLLIVNTLPLDVWTPGAQDKVDDGVRLLPADLRMLKRTYAHFWGEIYLAGRAWKALDAGAEKQFTMVLAGTYTLLSRHPVQIDGTTYRPGAAIGFSADSVHRLATLGPEDDLRLLWGRNVEIPDAEPLAKLTPDTH